jgi:hypothetical protein
MKTTDFKNKISSNVLNENMFKKFGVRINFENYSREQLEDYRNLLRTKLNHTESLSGYSELLKNEGYQKERHILELLNTRIKEMLGESKKPAKKLSPGEKKKREKIVKGMKKNKSDFEKRYPGKGKNVMYATDTKMAKKLAKDMKMMMLTMMVRSITPTNI